MGQPMYYTPRSLRPPRPPRTAPPTLGQMVWVPPEFLKFGSGSGHGERPAYAVTPSGRGIIFWVLPCTSIPPDAYKNRFFELWNIYFENYGDRPSNVFARSWLYERAEKLDFRATGPLERYVKLMRDWIGKPYAWWQERGMPRLV